MKDIPEFYTKRLILKGLQLTDMESYEKYFADYEVIQYLRHTVPWPYPKGGAKEHFLNKILPLQGIETWNWGLFLKENPTECIGSMNLWRKGVPEHRGFWLAKKHWGKGLMTEAVRPILNYAFTELGFEKLIFSNAPQNKASRRIKEKTGCRYIKSIPQKFVSPKFTKSELWELTKENWFKWQKEKKE